jgi:hypothetical protein
METRDSSCESQSILDFRLTLYLPRVVKIKMSKFKRKNSTHKSEIRDLKKDLEILPPKAA